MPKEELVSSNVAYFSFDEASNVLCIGYLTRYSEEVRVYRNKNVPASVVVRLRDASSKGKFVCSDIAFNYPYEFIGSETDT